MAGKLKFTADERLQPAWWMRESIILSEMERETRAHLEEVLISILSGILLVTKPDKRTERVDRINELYRSMRELLEPFRGINGAVSADTATRLIELWKQTFGEHPEMK